MSRPPGQFVTVSTVGKETVRAFVPAPPPTLAELEIGPALRHALDEALLALGRLDSVSVLLANKDLFLYAYVRKEAVLSSQIEGTQSTLSDLLLFEEDASPGVPLDDVQEVSCYVGAMQHGLKRLRSELPLSSRLIREIHGVLMKNGRGETKDPGEFRRSQNWIGGTRPGNARYVPPPPGRLADCMADLEQYLNDGVEKTPALLKAAVAHAQFETIHPFLDGNGRVGRLLIPLILCDGGVLSEPTLYPSLFLREHRGEYYDRLQATRDHGDWAGWLAFFVRGITETANGAVQAARRLSTMLEEDVSKLKGAGRTAGSALRVHHILRMHPIISVPRAAKLAGLSAPTARAALVLMTGKDLQIVREITGRKRDKLYAYTRYIDILNEGTERPLRA